MRDLLVRYRSTRGGAGGVIDDVVDEVARISKLYDRAFDAFVTEFVDTYMAAGGCGGSNTSGIQNPFAEGRLLLSES